MTKIEYIYEAIDDFGLISSAEAKELGISNAELVQMARRGKLDRVARGVYRMPVWPYQEAAPYAITVKSAGESAFLYGESVIALLQLAPTDPSKMWVATTSRKRRDLGDGVNLVKVPPKTRFTSYEGIPSQFVAEAIACATKTMDCDRIEEAVGTALQKGYLTASEAAELTTKLETPIDRPKCSRSTK